MMLTPRAQILIMAGISMTTAISAQYVVKKQDKQIEKLAKFGKSLIDAVAEYEAYAPSDVVVSVREKMMWDAMVREFNG